MNEAPNSNNRQTAARKLPFCYVPRGRNFAILEMIHDEFGSHHGNKVADVFTREQAKELTYQLNGIKFKYDAEIRSAVKQYKSSH